MPIALEPAEPEFSPQGVPYSTRYDDLYHSPEGGLAQAHHVFLGGNNLPQAWRGRDQFVILETGFGQGLNFLATWQAWRDDPARCKRLHVVSIEKHPFTQAGLAQVHTSLGDLATLGRELRDAWPLALPGLHRLEFDGGAVTLTLAFGDVAAMLPKLALGVDAFYLDGFSPSRNADMWAPTVMKRLARLARNDATLATYTSAGFVRRGLKDAGFTVSKVPGLGSKWEMTVARFAGDRPRRHRPPVAAQWPERRAIVIGAGLAGCAVTERLATRGWQITLFDTLQGPARLTSSHRAAAMHPHFSIDDGHLSRLSRAGNLYALRHWASLAQSGHPVGWQDCGVLQVGVSDDESRLQQAALAGLKFPERFARWMSREEACMHHGAKLARGGLWFESGGWAAPPDICEAQLAAAGLAVSPRFGCMVLQLRRVGDRWEALSETGDVMASAPVVVLANAHAALELMPSSFMEVRRIRGQLTALSAPAVEGLGSWPDCVLTGGGYLLPRAADGSARVGSSYEEDEGHEPLIARTAIHAENLGRLAGLLPAQADAIAALDAAALDGFVGLRSVSHNRLPLIGAVADEDAAVGRAGALRGAHLRDIPRLPGLYASLALASRGLTWAALGAELIASTIEGEPLPIESDLADAIDPARSLMRALRQGTADRSQSA